MEEGGDIEMVRTFFATLAAIGAAINVFHVAVEGANGRLGGHAFGKAAGAQHHGDGDILRAWLTVTARAAEGRADGIAEALDLGRFVSRQAVRRLPVEANQLVKFGRGFDSGYGDDIGELAKVCNGERRAFNHAAGERFHGNESHAGRLAESSERGAFIGQKIDGPL